MTKPHCVACHSEAPNGAEINVQGETYRLCPTCWSKVERGGRTPRQVVEAVLLSYDPAFDGPDCPCDHEDYRDLQLLGVWPSEEG
jgi:hypothetical protein